MPAGFNHIDIVGEKVRLRPVRASDAWFFTLLHSEWQDNQGRFRPRYEEIVLAGDE